MTTATDAAAPIGIIGGSGLYELLADGRTENPATPYGPASAGITLGELSGREVAFLPRHGFKHQFPPHKVNYRANMWALREVGVAQVIAVGAVGSLSREVPPGSLVVPDQLVDRTTGREQTYFDGPQTLHAAFADPFCPVGRTTVLTAAGAIDGGTQVVIQGPRFSSRAESAWYAAQGATLIGMTAMPEAALARELGFCYTSLCVVTDYDAGVSAGEGVTQAEVMAAFAASLQRVREALAALVPTVPATPECGCAELGLFGAVAPD